MGGPEGACIFCNIAGGQVPADKVYEDEFVVGFWDARPVRPIHILIVPREHIPTLNDVPAENPIMCHIGQAARKIAEHFGVDQAGYRLLFNVNKAGWQEIFHLHAHLIARRDGERV